MINKESKNVIRERRHARVRAKISGTAECPRLCVYRSNKHIEAQIIDDVKRVTLCAASSVDGLADPAHKGAPEVTMTGLMTSMPWALHVTDRRLNMASSS